MPERRTTMIPARAAWSSQQARPLFDPGGFGGDCGSIAAQRSSGTRGLLMTSRGSDPGLVRYSKPRRPDIRSAMPIQVQRAYRSSLALLVMSSASPRSLSCSTTDPPWGWVGIPAPLLQASTLRVQLADQSRHEAETRTAPLISSVAACSPRAPGRAGHCGPDALRDDEAVS